MQWLNRMSEYFFQYQNQTAQLIHKHNHDQSKTWILFLVYLPTSIKKLETGSS